MAENIYRLAYAHKIPGMTDEQWNKILAIYNAYRQKSPILTLS